jgi:hypothetical protein
MRRKKKANGRPSIFTQQIADHICERISLGETLRSICTDPALPDRVTIYRWMDKYPDFCNQYAKARLLQADTYFDQIVEEAFSSHDAGIGRLRMDALKWVSSKLAPKKYGDRIEHEHSGSQKLNLTFTIGGRNDEPFDFDLLERSPGKFQLADAKQPETIDV